MGFGEARETKVSKGVLLNVWTMAAETVSDIEFISKRMRASMDTEQVIRQRRLLLSFTGLLSQAMRAHQEGKDTFEQIKKTLLIIRDISALLERMKEKSKDGNRIEVINDRLTSIKKRLEEAVGIVL